MYDDDESQIPILEQFLRYYGGSVFAENIIPCPEESLSRVDWSSLPLLPLTHVLQYLNRTDAIASMSTCRHWRGAMLMYEGCKPTIKLRVNDLERSLFVTRIFKKNAKRLIVYADGTEDEMDAFTKQVLTQYFGVKLAEMVFVGDCYLKQNPMAAVPVLRRIPIESMMLYMRSLKKLSLLGCVMGDAKDEKMNKKIEVFSRGLKFSSDPSPSDTVLSRCNSDLMKFSTLQSIIMDYEQISTEALETLSSLPSFKHLTMVIRERRHFALKPINWLRLQAHYPNHLAVTVVLIQLPYKRFEDVMDNVFIQGLKLVSLKGMFCQNMHLGAIVQVVNMYKASLQEFVWADCPYESTDQTMRSVKNIRLPEFNMANINPIILMCWQCPRLRRIVIHGYWIWQYDILGMIRLRRELRHLEVSAVYAADAGALDADGIARVLLGDRQRACGEDFLGQVAEFGEDWTPVPWSKLHPGLRARSSSKQRADYILHEVRLPFGVM